MPVATYAQQAPDAGTLLRNESRPSDVQLPAAPPVLPAARPSAPSVASGVRVDVTAFDITGATLVPVERLKAVVAAFVGTGRSFADLQKAADAVAQVYRDEGWLARTFLPEQDLGNGVVRVSVIEGRLGTLRVDSAGQELRLRESTVRRFMLARNQPGQPVNVDDSQRAINLLNDLPGVQASALLEPGATEGESGLVIRARDQSPWSGFAQADNGGVKSTGSGRLTGLASLDDPLGIGDQLGLTASLSEGSRYGRLGYALPVNGDGLRAGVSGSVLHYDYDALGSRFNGSANSLGGTLTYPVHRANDWNLNVGLAYDAKWFENFNDTSGVRNTLSDKDTQAGSLIVSGNAYDAILGGGYNQFLLSFTAGRLNLGGDAADLASDQTAGGPDRQGHYGKFTMFATRLQRITQADSLFVSISGQAANRNLDSSEKISMGGPSAVRAYPAGEANGDEGLLATVEWRHRFNDSLQVAAFYDAARVRRDHHPNGSTSMPGTFDLSGAGVAVAWGDAKTLAISATVAARLGSNPLVASNGSDPSGTQRHARFWLTAVHAF